MSATSELRRTSLYEQHKALGARLVDFHGWELPIQYESIIKEHEAVRKYAGLFDVSHMGQVWVRGKDALAFLQKVNANDIARIGPGKAIYSHLPNETGGIVDDVIVSCLEKDRYLVVVNASTREKDVAWLKKQAHGLQVELDDKSDHYAMIALQGPEAARIAGMLYPDVPALPRFGAMELSFFDQPGVVTRTGYTGEDGFEFIVPAEIASRLWDNLLLKGRALGLAPCGLGARDTLRLEAGLLLYGNDIDDEHTTFEADYGWVVKLEKGDFIGRAALQKQKAEGLKRKLTGVKLLERGVPRAGAPVFVDGKQAGALCSATFSPCLQTGIGVGYLDRPDLPPGTKVELEIHGRRVAGEVVKPPFYNKQKKEKHA
jgi:aminomethyltransferase